MADASNKVRLTADLPISEVTLLKDLAEKQKVTLTEALRRAIKTEGLLQERRDDGAKVLLEKNGALTELIFNR
jgi:hypothetical protein